MKQEFEVQEIILDQLKQSKIHGFPFFAYTGIKSFVMAGDNNDGNPQLKLDCPKNPNQITHLWITYIRGLDVYAVSFHRDNNNFDTPAQHGEVYCDQLAEIITEQMGVW